MVVLAYFGRSFANQEVILLPLMIDIYIYIYKTIVDIRILNNTMPRQAGPKPP